MRIVLDSNVVVSIFVFKGRLLPLRGLMDTRQVRVLSSRMLIDEYFRALSYPKFKQSKEEVLEALNVIADNSLQADEARGALPRPCRDPDDEMILRLALGGQADVLVTGDKDLLVLEGTYPFSILNPSDFLMQFFPQHRIAAPEASLTSWTRAKPKARAKRAVPSARTKPLTRSNH